VTATRRIKTPPVYGNLFPHEVTPHPPLATTQHIEAAINANNMHLAILGPVSNADGRYDDNFVDNFTKKFKAHLAGE
jgi:hypothetical protein